MEKVITDGSLLNTVFKCMSRRSMDDPGRQVIQGWESCVQGSRDTKDLTNGAAQRATVSKLRYRQGLLATTVSLHSLSYSFCTQELWRMSAVKIGSRCIIKSIMLLLKPGPCFRRNPQLHKGTLASHWQDNSTFLEVTRVMSEGKVRCRSW